MCDSCLNNSTCSIITDLNLNVTTVHCLCGPGWFGQRCESHANLLLVSVTMTTVTLHWDAAPHGQFHSESTLNNGRSNRNESHDYLHQNFVQSNSTQSSRFSVFYWTSNRRQQCNIVPNLTKNVSTISGLTENTKYIFCGIVDYLHKCDFDLVNHKDIGTTCIYVTTRSQPSIPIVYVIIVSCVACIGILTLLFILAIAKRNDFLPILICAKEAKLRSNQRDRTLPKPRMPNSSDEGHPDVYIYDTTNTNQKISIHPPNCPGKPKYQLTHKRMRGYASFTARNEQTIPLSTVLEYTTREHDDDEALVDTDVETDDDEIVQTETPFINDNET